MFRGSQNLRSIYEIGGDPLIFSPTPEVLPLA
jgi:hypothetical protein